jgi:hypothetical protein
MVGVGLDVVRVALGEVLAVRVALGDELAV